MLETWVGKIPWRRERLPTPVLWPGEFHGLYSPWGHKESDMTEQLSLSIKTLFFCYTKTQFLETHINLLNNFLWSDILICVLSIVHSIDVKFSVLTIKNTKKQPKGTQGNLEVMFITMTVVIIHRYMHMFKPT